jgi:hypothetical protein
MGGELPVSDQILAAQEPSNAVEDFSHLPSGDKFPDRKEGESKSEVWLGNSLAEIWWFAKREFAFSHSGA